MNITNNLKMIININIINHKTLESKFLKYQKKIMKISLTKINLIKMDFLRIISRIHLNIKIMI